MRYQPRSTNLQPIASTKPQLFQSLAQKFSAFENERQNELDVAMAKKAKEKGMIDAQGKTALTLRDGTTIADESWNRGAVASHAAAIKLDLKENMTRIAEENPDPVEFEEIAKGYASGLLSGVDESLRPAVQDEASSYILNGKIAAEKNLRTAQLKERQEISGNAYDLAVEQALDALDSMDIEDAEKYEAQAIGIINAMVGDRSMTTAEGIKAKEELSDKMDSAIVVGNFKDALERGKDDEFLKKFSSKKLGHFFEPDKREKLLTKMLTIRSHRNSIDSIKRKEGLKEIDLYTKALVNGFTPSKGETVRVSEIADKAGLGEEFQKAVNDIQEVAHYGKAPASLRREKIALLGESGKIKDYKKWQALKKADATITKAAQKDGYALAVQQEIIKPSPLDYSSPSSFKARAEQAKFLSVHYSVNVSPLSLQETASMIEAAKQMTPQEKTNLAMSINAADNDKLLQDIAEKQAPMFAMVAAIGVPEIAETIFTGQKEIDEGNIKLPSREDYIADMDEYLANVYSGEDLAATREASLAYYAALAGNVEYDDDKLEEAMKAVTGGIVEINGSPIELPRGVDESTMEDFVDDFSSLGVEQIGGVDFRSNDEAAQLIRDGIWISKGAGEYAVLTKFGELMQNGQPLRIKYSTDLTPRRAMSFDEFQNR